MKTNNELMREGRLLRTYRTLIGMKQNEAAEMFNTKQGNYCRMEQGRANAGYRLSKMKNLFCKWREGEVIRLENRITYLKEL